MYDKVIDSVIIKCPECKQKLRFSLFQRKVLVVKCSKCNSTFDFSCKRYRIKRALIRCCFGLLLTSIVVADVVVPFILIAKLRPAIVEVKNKTQDNYKRKIAEIKGNFSKEIATLNNVYTQELMKVDKDKLKEEAISCYAKIWEERKNHNRKYALTPREKARLEMLTLARDRTEPIEKIIRSIARKAAPTNSEITTYTTSTGIRLDINFDMSELTSGEEGTRTKHSNINSLKKETIRLISKVTNDVYEFCQDLDLETIAIGCKHFVNSEDEYGSSVKKNIILYKIRLDRKNIKELEHNPFLDIYSTTKYFKVEKDDFPNLSIVFY